MKVAQHQDVPAVLLVGDAARAEGPLRSALPGVHVDHADNYFNAIVHLGSSGPYDAVLVPVMPVQNRARAAVENLRAAAGDAKVLIVTEPDGEILSRKLVGQGIDDYLVWPLAGADLAAAIQPPPSAPVAPPATAAPAPAIATPRPGFSFDIPVAEIVLDALVREPAEAVRVSVDEVNRHLPRGQRLILSPASERAPFAPTHARVFTRPVGERSLHLIAPRDDASAESLLDLVAAQLGRALQLQLRHAGLQKMAITDDLTGLYNCRYFKHGLSRILARAREGKFPVTLLLFDIDGFKKYNDQFGHAAGDEILRQTAKMMKRCVRDHDLVARLGGDEFAVVFWENEPSRAPYQAKHGEPVGPSRPPTSPQLVFERFRKLVASHDFQALGESGKGELTISGGLAVYPYDATTADDLIGAADKALMFGAKKSGKNMLHLVGRDGDQVTGPA